jgi:hypothetical protein
LRSSRGSKLGCGRGFCPARAVEVRSCSARLKRAFSGFLKTKNKWVGKNRNRWIFKTWTVRSYKQEPFDPRNSNRSILVEVGTLRF